jgi:hypothetical protein
MLIITINIQTLKKHKKLQFIRNTHGAASKETITAVTKVMPNPILGPRYNKAAHNALSNLFDENNLKDFPLPSNFQALSDIEKLMYLRQEHRRNFVTYMLQHRQSTHKQMIAKTTQEFYKKHSHDLKKDDPLYKEKQQTYQNNLEKHIEQTTRN